MKATSIPDIIEKPEVNSLLESSEPISNHMDREFSNIPPHIFDLMDRKLYKIKNHPLQILVNKIEQFFKQEKISDIEIDGEQFELF
jgi:hypothetical protein